MHADNVEALGAFLLLQTQWNVAVGASGVVWLGLNYAAVPVVFDALQLPQDQRSLVFAELRIMEKAALAVRNDKLRASGSDGQ